MYLVKKSLNIYGLQHTSVKNSFSLLGQTIKVETFFYFLKGWAKILLQETIK